MRMLWWECCDENASVRESAQDNKACCLLRLMSKHHEAYIATFKFNYPSLWIYLLWPLLAHPTNTLSPVCWQVHVTNRTAEASTWLHEQSSVVGPFRGGPASFSHDVASCIHAIVSQLCDSNINLSHLLYWRGISFTLSLILPML